MKNALIDRFGKAQSSGEVIHILFFTSFGNALTTSIPLSKPISGQIQWQSKKTKRLKKSEGSISVFLWNLAYIESYGIGFRHREAARHYVFSQCLVPWFTLSDLVHFIYWLSVEDWTLEKNPAPAVIDRVMVFVQGCCIESPKKAKCGKGNELLCPVKNNVQSRKPCNQCNPTDQACARRLYHRKCVPVQSLSSKVRQPFKVGNRQRGE